MTNVNILRAGLNHLDNLVPLFDGYRRSYGQVGDVGGVREFLRERLERSDSALFLAADASGEKIGFTQLYPSFSSVAMCPIWILNDLFVAPEARKRGVGTALLAAAVDFGKQQGAKRLVLATAIDNAAAQSLYVQLGWKLDTTFLHYAYEL